MRIKKYENASSPIERLPYIRNYQWRIMPQTERKYKDYYLDSDVLSGDRVWTDEQGNIVTTDTPNAAADFAVQYRNPRFELDYPEITIEGNGKGYFTGESFADRYARELTAPIAKNADADNTFKEQALWLHEQSKEKHEADVKAADARANQLTPGVGTFVVAPVAATLAGIGGATLAPFLAPGTIGGNIIGTTAFGEALSHAIKYGTGKTMGEHAVNAAHYLGIPLSKWGDFGIQMLGDTPVYLTGDIVGKAITSTGRTLGKEALKLMALDNIPSTKDLAISRILLLNDMAKIAATSKVTPERLRLWKGLMYLTNGRPSEGIRLAKKRLSSNELVDFMKYVRTGDTNALSKLKSGYVGFIRRGSNPESWKERYTTITDPTKADLLDLTLLIQNSVVNIPELYTQLAKSSAILPKNETVDILGGLIVGNKSAITNPYILNLLASENVPKGFTPIVTDEYANGVNAIKRLNTETPIMQYSLQTHQIKSNKLGEEGMFNTTGMHNFIYKDPESRNLKLVEVDVFKNTIGGIKQKYAGVENEATNLYGKMVSKGKQHMFKKFNLAEQSPVLIVKEKDLDVNDILNALAMQEKHIYLGRASLEAGQITKEQFATIQKEAQLTEARLLEMLTDMNPEYYLTKLTEVNNKSKRLLGKPDANGHFRDKSDIHIESVLDKIILTQGSRKIPQTTIPEDRERLNEIIRSSMKYGKEKATLHTAIHKSLVGTPETLNPVYKHYYRMAEPEAYSKAIKEHDLKSFTEAPLDNISVLFNYGKAYNPQVLTPSTRAKLNNTLYIILRYDLKDPNVRQKAMEMVEKGYTLFDPQKMKDPNVFYNTIKECKEQYMKKLQEIIPFVSNKIKPHLIKSQKATVTLPSTLKPGGKLIPRKFQFGGIPELSDMTLPDLTVYVGPKGGKLISRKYK